MTTPQKEKLGAMPRNQRGVHPGKSRFITYYDPTSIDE
jgi:hypothetical protein